MNDYAGRLTEMKNRISETYNEYYNETFGWYFRGGNDLDEKVLPYRNLEDVRKVQQYGARLFHNNATAKNIHENLLNYIVGNGHTYSTIRLDGQAKDDQMILRAQNAIDRHMAYHNWPEFQEEFFNRLFRSGETIQLTEPDGDVLDFAWLEPHKLVGANTSSVVAPFGIEYDKGRVRKPSRFYARGENGQPDPFDASEVIFAKRGVDSNDPRGIPLLWLAYCQCREVDELFYAVTQLAIAICENAVSYDYDSSVGGPLIKAASQAIADRQEDLREQGIPNDGGRITHAKNFKVSIQGQAAIIGQILEGIDAKKREIGGLASLPEFIVTGNADTGTRNTLLSAEAPLIRRVGREAARGSRVNVEFLYRAIALEFGELDNPDWLRQFRKEYAIQPSIPTPETGNKLEESNRIINELEHRLISPQQACDALSRKYDQVMDEWRAHEEFIGEIRASAGSTYALDAADIQKRVDTVAGIVNAYKAAGQSVDVNEVMEMIGLDPLLHADLLPMPTQGPPDATRQSDPNQTPATSAASPAA